MPSAPKSPPSLLAAASPSTKRAGAPKAKGAVRAKSGCYTCRIRRKKCDEQPNDQGHCSTCVRLRLECLGFGAKRPDWLRENHNVVLLRDKIKNFLASQGMIKGHSGSGARSSEQPAILRLTLESDSSPYHSSSSSSPPSPPPRPLPNTEYSPRRGIWGPTYDQYPYPRGSATASEPRSASPQSNEGYPPHLTSSTSTVQFPRRVQYRYHPYPHRQMQLYPQASWSPALQSTFGDSYNLNSNFFASELPSAEQIDNHLAYNMGDGGNADPFMPAMNASGTYSFPPYLDAFHLPTALKTLLLRYKTDVVTVQYLLSTKYIRDLIVNTIVDGQPVLSDPTSEQQAAALLSRVFFLRFARPDNELVLQIPDIRLQLLEIERSLNKNGRDLSSSAEDAMAALHLVSVVLFDGGCGAWRHYLEIASGYVRVRMRGLKHNVDGLEELRKLSEKEAFIVKTAIWFDVLASVTTGKRPLLMDIIKQLFKPGQSKLEELEIIPAFSPSGATTALADAARVSNPDEEKSSMVSPMGCQNKVVWALAEINALAAWKEEQRALGRLSIKDFVQRSLEIERELEVKHHYTVRILSDFNDDPVAYSRYIVSNIFRASAMLYLHSVVSDGYPHVFQIKCAVDEVMRWIRRIPKKPRTELDRKVHKSIIRSAVFGFYITGALTDDMTHRKLIQEYLLEEAGEHVGNVRIIVSILQEIWKDRATARTDGRKPEVPWREKLLMNNDAPVLLV